MIDLLFSAFPQKYSNYYCRVFIAYILPKLEYASEVWNPYFVRDVDILERVLRLFTRRLSQMNGVSYEYRLNKLHWCTLQDRRLQKDLIMTYKIVRGLVEIDFDGFFSNFRTIQVPGIIIINLLLNGLG